MYRVRRVRSRREQNLVNVLHAVTFPVDTPVYPYPGMCWLTWDGDEPVGFLALQKASRYPRAAYLARVGVRADHRGHGLQVRMSRVAERYARKAGYCQIISDTCHNPPSERSFERLGYEEFQPRKPWGLPAARYWWKPL